MAVYSLIDLETTDDGDLAIDNIGDLKIASPFRTVVQAINNIILTNRGELLTDPSFGANLQAYYGEKNDAYSHQMIEREIIEEIRKQGYIDLADIDVDVVPVDINEAALLVSMKGQFIDTETTGAFGTFTPPYDGITMGYIYPFTSGRIVPA